MIHARMTIGGADDPEDAAPLPLRNPQVRPVVLEGLQRVTRTGTAGWLGHQFAAMGYGPDVRLLGKTGTMKVAGQSDPDLGNVILRDLAQHDCGLRWDPQAGVLKFGAVAPRTHAEAAKQVLALKELRCRVRVAGKAPLADQVATEMQRHACGYRNCASPDLSPQADGRVVDVPVRETAETLVDGHAIAVVAGKYVGEQPVRGLTIVVNIQDKRQADSPALAVAAQILRSPVAKDWINRGPWP
jgi:hypothetical protein